MTFIEPQKVWFHVRMPQLPVKFSGWVGFDEFQNQEMTHALDLLGQLQKTDGTRRSVTGLNRLGQRRWPERDWRIENTEQIAEAWKIAGLFGLAELVAAGKSDFPWGRTYRGSRPGVKQVLAIDVSPPENAEVFVSASFAVKRLEEGATSWSAFLVRAETDFGLYSFYMASHQPPELWEAERLCIYHNHVAGESVVQSKFIL